jgi:hypothetical protein
MKKTESGPSENSPSSDSNLIQRSEGFHLYVGLVRKLVIDIIMALCTSLVTTILTVPICVILIIWIVPRIMRSQMDKIDSSTLAVIVLIIVIWEVASSAVKAVWGFGTRERVKRS